MKLLQVFGLAVLFTSIGFLLGKSYDQLSNANPATSTNKKSIIASNTTAVPYTKKNASINDAVNPASAGATTKNEQTNHTLNQGNSEPTNDVDLARVTSMINSFTTHEQRLTSLTQMFESSAHTPEIDSDSAIDISDFFRQQQALENFIPQQIECHSDICRVDLPLVDNADTNKLMETLSQQLSEQKLKASHILLANDANNGSTKLFISLTPKQVPLEQL